jgi:2'-5' RNA ligase
VAQTGDTILVHFLKPQPVGQRFRYRHNEWPLHITLVPWFFTEKQVELLRALTAAAEWVQPFTVELQKTAWFDEDTKVTLVGGAGLPELHQRLLEVVAANNGQLANTTWVGKTYKPHVTHHQDAVPPAKGSKIVVDNISLVRLKPENICEVEHNFPLGAAQ